MYIRGSTWDIVDSLNVRQISSHLSIVCYIHGLVATESSCINREPSNPARTLGEFNQSPFLIAKSKTTVLAFLTRRLFLVAHLSFPY